MYGHPDETEDATDFFSIEVIERYFFVLCFSRDLSATLNPHSTLRDDKLNSKAQRIAKITGTCRNGGKWRDQRIPSEEAIEPCSIGKRIALNKGVRSAAQSQ